MAPLYFLPILFLLAATIAAQSPDDPSKVLPKEIDGWKTDREKEFDNKTLYNHIDGGAELFLSFGFSKVYHRAYTDKDENQIFVDIFYMNTSFDAFGVFSYTASKIDSSYGKQSQIFPGAVIFWQNNLYISITSAPETEEGNKLIAKLAAMIDSSITTKGPKPEILKYLPSGDLDIESIRYFRHYVWLNTHFFLSNENILNINQNTQAVTAQYGKEGDKSVLLLVEYKSDSEAAAAVEKFKSGFNKQFEKTSLFSSEKRWFGYERNGWFFIAVLNGESEKITKDLINDTKSGTGIN